MSRLSKYLLLKEVRSLLSESVDDFVKEHTYYRAGGYSESKGLFVTDDLNYAKAYASERGVDVKTIYILPIDSSKIYSNTSQARAYVDLFNDKFAIFIKWMVLGIPPYEKKSTYIENAWKKDLSYYFRKYDLYTHEGKYTLIADVDIKINKVLKSRGYDLIEYTDPSELPFLVYEGVKEYVLLNTDLITTKEELEKQYAETN